MIVSYRAPFPHRTTRAVRGMSIRSSSRSWLLLKQMGMFKADFASIGGGCSPWHSGSGGTRCLTYALVACVLEA